MMAQLGAPAKQS